MIIFFKILNKLIIKIAKYKKHIYFIERNILKNKNKNI